MIDTIPKDVFREIEQFRDKHNTIATMSDSKIEQHVHAIITIIYDNVLDVLRAGKKKTIEDKDRIDALFSLIHEHGKDGLNKWFFTNPDPLNWTRNKFDVAINAVAGRS